MGSLPLRPFTVRGAHSAIFSRSVENSMRSKSFSLRKARNGRPGTGVVLAEDQGHVRNRVDELGVRQNLFFNQGSPELAGHLELLVNVQGLDGGDGAVRTGGCIVELAQCRVAGTGVVPGLVDSWAALSRRSSRMMFQVGSSSLRNTPRVALMMPPPTRTTSVRSVRATTEFSLGVWVPGLRARQIIVGYII